MKQKRLECTINDWELMHTKTCATASCISSRKEDRATTYKLDILIRCQASCKDTVADKTIIMLLWALAYQPHRGVFKVFLWLSSILKY